MTIKQLKLQMKRNELNKFAMKEILHLRCVTYVVTQDVAGRAERMKGFLS
jgi:hypothetical protein